MSAFNALQSSTTNDTAQQHITYFVLDFGNRGCILNLKGQRGVGFCAQRHQTPFDRATEELTVCRSWLGVGRVNRLRGISQFLKGVCPLNPQNTALFVVCLKTGFINDSYSFCLCRLRKEPPSYCVLFIFLSVVKKHRTWISVTACGLDCWTVTHSSAAVPLI